MTMWFAFGITDMVACIQKLHTVDMINHSDICFLGKYDIMCWVQQLLFHFGTYNPYLSGSKIFLEYTGFRIM